jgi:predicted TIM-barrel fold metal-dependent hydrolase
VVDKLLLPHPTRFGGFAAVALQDPKAAIDETQRAIQTLSFKGALIDGYVNRGDADHGEYLDLPKFRPFWECTGALGVPVYGPPWTTRPRCAGCV